MSNLAKWITLCRHPLSGHSHWAQLLLSVLELPDMVDVDLLSGVHKQSPVIDNDGTVIYDSNAILVYLTSKYDVGGKWLPREPVTAARVQAWLSVAAGPVEYGPAAARLVTVFGAKYDANELIQRSNARRIEALKAFVPMQRTAMGLAA